MEGMTTGGEMNKQIKIKMKRYNPKTGFVSYTVEGELKGIKTDMEGEHFSLRFLQQYSQESAEIDFNGIENESELKKILGLN